MPWTANDIPDQLGRVAIVTGANSGLGLETSRVLAGKGATVIMACRSLERAEQAEADILQSHPEAKLELMTLNLASLASVRQFAESFEQAHDTLSLLINNAGVMAIPRRETEDGFEMQLGVNHLGHFALTMRLMDTLLSTPKSRVVNVSSYAEYMGRIDFDDLMGKKSYGRWQAYGQSKLANVLFTYELHRRLEATGAETQAVAAHPGLAASDLRAKQIQTDTPLLHRLSLNLFEVFTQPTAQGALPQLYAATAPDLPGGTYYGPDGFLQQRGYPRRLRSSKGSYSKEVAKRLWEVSEELTGVRHEKLQVTAKVGAA